MSMIRLFIADDHPLIRKGLREILEGEVDLEVVGEATNDQELLDGIRNRPPDVLITDLSMPGRGILTVIADVKRANPKLPILVLTMHPEERFAVRALRSGVSGYLTKDTAPEEIVRAVRTLARGQKYITASLAEKLALELGRDPEKPLHETLSNREFQIMRALAGGRKIKEIAGDLCISIHTVNTYKSRIMEKMGMKSVTELTMYALEKHLIE
jgi:two-component system, NarL family, invasion response regulator UvrY